jgi:uncharacterized protein YjiS (DUF1127 family)
MRFSKPGAEKVSFAEACRKPKFIGKTLPGTTLSAAGKIWRVHMTAIHLRPCRDDPSELRRGAALDALSDATEWVIARLGEWRRRSRERGQLAGFDERMLQDIGLCRGDAEFLINKPFWKE